LPKASHVIGTFLIAGSALTTGCDFNVSNQVTADMSLLWKTLPYDTVVVIDGIKIGLSNPSKKTWFGKATKNSNMNVPLKMTYFLDDSVTLNMAIKWHGFDQFGVIKVTSGKANGRQTPLDLSKNERLELCNSTNIALFRIARDIRNKGNGTSIYTPQKIPQKR
jgi:hypothetical protein